MGEKTAAKWIREFGSLDALVDRVDEVKGKAGDALRENLAAVLRNRQLTELVRDVPLDRSGRDDLRAGPWDREEMHQLFDTLQFRVLRERLYADAARGGAEAARPRGQRLSRFEVRRPARRRRGRRVAGRARAGPASRVGLASRGTWGRGTGTLTGLAHRGRRRRGGVHRPDRS